MCYVSGPLAIDALRHQEHVQTVHLADALSVCNDLTRQHANAKCNELGGLPAGDVCCAVVEQRYGGSCGGPLPSA